jgi:stage III sporulation protein AE
VTRRRRRNAALAAIQFWLAAVIVLLGAPAGASPYLPAASGLSEQPLLAQLQGLDTAPLEAYLQEVNRTWEGYGPQLSLREFLALYRGEESSPWSPAPLFWGLLRYLFREVVANGALLAKLVVLSFAAAILSQLQTAFGDDGAGRVAHGVVYLVLIGLALSGFGLAVATAREVIRALSGFLVAILPTLLTVLAGLGGVTSAAIFHPLMITIMSVTSTVMQVIVFPLVFLSAVLEIVSGFNENFRLTNLAGLLRQAAMVVIGLLFTVFLGVVAIKGAAGAVADGLGMKTAKFLAGSFIPVIGKMFADATELLFGSTLLLKNALGMLGAAGIFLIAVFPLLKIISLVFVYRLAAAIVQPAGAAQIAASLGTMANSLQLVFASVAVVALMFFLAVSVIVGAGNLTVMVR